MICGQISYYNTCDYFGCILFYYNVNYTLIYIHRPTARFRCMQHVCRCHACTCVIQELKNHYIYGNIGKNNFKCDIVYSHAAVCTPAQVRHGTKFYTVLSLFYKNTKSFYIINKVFYIQTVMSSLAARIYTQMHYACNVHVYKHCQSKDGCVWS